RPRVHRPEADRRRLPVFSLEQALAIHREGRCNVSASSRNARSDGLRAGELLVLRWKDCDLTNRRFTISNTVWRGQLQTTKPKRMTGLSECRNPWYKRSRLIGRKAISPMPRVLYSAKPTESRSIPIHSEDWASIRRWRRPESRIKNERPAAM